MKAPTAGERGPGNHWLGRGGGVQPPYGRQGRVPCLGAVSQAMGWVLAPDPAGVTQQEPRATGLSLTLRSSGGRPCRQEPAPPVTEAKHLGLTAGNEDRALSAAEEGPPLMDLQAAGGSGGMRVWPGGPEGRCVWGGRGGVCSQAWALADSCVAPDTRKSGKRPWLGKLGS